MDITIFEYCGFGTGLGDVDVPLVIVESLRTMLYDIGDPDDKKYPYLEETPEEVLIGPKTSKRSFEEAYTPYKDQPELEKI